MPKIANFSLGRNPESSQERMNTADLREEGQRQMRGVIELADEWGSRVEPVTFKDFKSTLRTSLFALGRILVMLFLG